MKMDFRYKQTDQARTSQNELKIKPTLATETWENKKRGI